MSNNEEEMNNEEKSKQQQEVAVSELFIYFLGKDRFSRPKVVTNKIMAFTTSSTIPFSKININNIIPLWLYNNVVFESFIVYFHFTVKGFSW